MIQKKSTITNTNTNTNTTNTDTSTSTNTCANANDDANASITTNLILPPQVYLATRYTDQWVKNTKEVRYNLIPGLW
jgi:hypothetical protein